MSNRDIIKPRNGKLWHDILREYNSNGHHVCKHTLAYSAFTQYSCMKCKNKYEYPNSNTPKVCVNCFEFDKCIYCLNDLKEWAKKR